MRKLPDFEDIALPSSKGPSPFKTNLESTENILKKLLINIQDIKAIEKDNSLLKNSLLGKQSLLKQEFEKRLKKIAHDLKTKEDLDEINLKVMLRRHEEIKLELNKQLVIEKKRNDFLANKIRDVSVKNARLDEEKKKLERLNQKILQRLLILEKTSLANENVLEARTKIIKDTFEKRFKGMARIQLNKEIDYKARIDSLSKDLAKYYEELKKSKINYYRREKELKQKLREIIN